jgi:hypothetical protein
MADSIDLIIHVQMTKAWSTELKEITQPAPICFRTMLAAGKRDSKNSDQNKSRQDNGTAATSNHACGAILIQFNSIQLTQKQG